MAYSVGLCIHTDEGTRMPFTILNTCNSRARTYFYISLAPWLVKLKFINPTQLLTHLTNIFDSPPQKKLLLQGKLYWESIEKAKNHKDRPWISNLKILSQTLSLSLIYGKLNWTADWIKLVFKNHSSLHQTWGQFNSGINGQFQFWNWLFKKNGIGIFDFESRHFELELKFPTKKFNPEINLLFIQH